MSQKIDFANQARSAATLSLTALEALRKCYAVYFARGYHSAGTNAILDADIASANLDANTLTGIINFVGNYEKFMNGDAVIDTNWLGTLNAARNDI
jgi:hypothetical protein